MTAPAPAVSGIVVEACVDSIGSALAAQEGGAHRIELCANLVEGGTTPSAGMLAAVRARLVIPLFVLIRPRGGDFLYSDEEAEVMRRDTQRAKAMGADGVVIGALRRDGTIDEARVRSLMQLARPLAVTFHRAFDVCRDAAAQLETLVALGVDRVLTSGGAPTAPEGAAAIAGFQRAAGGRIGILPGGGISAADAPALVRQTGVSEIHLTGAVTVHSRMDYRAPHVTIGNPPPGNPYEWSATSAEEIQRVVLALG